MLPASPTSTSPPSSRRTDTSYSGVGRPMHPGRPGFWYSSITGWLTVSVMPYQAIERSPKRASSDGTHAPRPHIRKLWLVGISRSARARTVKGIIDDHVHRLRTATSQYREAEKRGISAADAPAHNVANVEYDSALM